MASASSRSMDDARGAARPVAWLGLGAVLALGVQRGWTPGEPAAAEPVRAVTRAADSSVAEVRASVDATANEVASTQRRDDVAPAAIAPSPAAIAPSPAAIAPSPGAIAPSPGAIAASREEIGEAPAPTRAEAPADASAPTLPLPRMPGSTRLSSSAHLDAATGTWKLKAAFKVHAHVPHVLAFYRKALADAGLAVDEQGGEDGPLVLVGKSDRVHAQIGIRTKPNELETRVWVLWRVRA